MPKTSEMRESKFLKQSDVGNGVLATIKSCIRMNVNKEGAEADMMRWCLTFTNLDKPLVLNFVNQQSCEEICKSDDTDDWIGKEIVLYTDPNVVYGGKRTGGIRIRAPKVRRAPVMEINDDDIPF